MKIELYHDVLARKVYEQASAEEKMRLKVERHIRERYAYYLETKRRALLNKDDLQYIAPYLEQVDITPEQRRFVEDSRRAVSRAVMRRRGYVAVVVVILGLLGVASWQWNIAQASAQVAEEARQKISDINQILVHSQDSLKNLVLDKNRAVISLDTALDLYREIIPKIIDAKNDADQARRRAESSEKNAQLQRKVNHLIAQALDLRGIKPTLALQLAHYACKMVDNDNELAVKIRAKVYDTYSGTFCAKNLHGHSDAISDIAFSPDGQLIMTGSLDHTAKLWNLEGEELVTFRGHTGAIWSVAFSPDGKTILTGSYDHSAKLWSLDGQEIQSFQGHDEGVNAIFSPNGTNILTGSHDQTAKLWDTKGNLIQRFSGHEGRIFDMAFSSDGRTILTGSGDNTAKLWDLNGKEIRTFEGHKDAVIEVAFSPNGRTILTGSADNTAKMWDPNGREIQSYEGHKDRVRAISFSPDGDRILTAGDDQTIIQWDLQGNLINQFRGHAGSISSVLFSPDNNYILTGSDDATAKLWETKDRSIQGTISASSIPRAAVFSPNGQTVLIGTGDDTAELYNLQGDLIQRFLGHQGSVVAVAFSPDGNYILTGSNDKTAKLWDLDGRELKSFDRHTGSVDAVAFSSDGKKILTGGSDDTVKLWDLNGNELRTINGYTSSVLSIAVSPTEETFLTGESDGAIRKWDFKGNLIQTIAEPAGVVFKSFYGIAFSPDGKTFVTGSYDRTAKLWDSKGRMLQSFTGHEKGIKAVAISPDGQKVLTSSGDGMTLLWDRKGNLIQTFQPSVFEFTPSVAFHPQREGLILISSSGYNFQLRYTLDYLMEHDFFDPITFEEKERYGILSVSDCLKSARYQDLQRGIDYFIEKDSLENIPILLKPLTRKELLNNRSYQELQGITAFLLSKIEANILTPLFKNQLLKVLMVMTSEEKVAQLSIQELLDLATFFNSHLVLEEVYGNQRKNNINRLGSYDFLKNQELFDLSQIFIHFLYRNENTDLLENVITLIQNKVKVTSAEELAMTGEYLAVGVDAQDFADQLAPGYYSRNQKEANYFIYEILTTKGARDLIKGNGPFTKGSFAQKVKKYTLAVQLQEEALSKDSSLILKNHLAIIYNVLAWNQFFNHQPEAAVQSCLRGLEVDELPILYTNLVLGYLYSGQYGEAEKWYRQLKDEVFEQYEPGYGGQPFKTVFLADLDALEKAGITHPDVAKIRRILE